MKTLCLRCIRQDHCCNYLPPPLQHLHGFGYNGIVRIHLSTWLVLQLEGSVHSVPRDVTLPSLDNICVFTCMCSRRTHVWMISCLLRMHMYVCFHVYAYVCSTCAHLCVPRVLICVFTCAHMCVPTGHVFVFQENTCMLSDERVCVCVWACSACTCMCVHLYLCSTCTHLCVHVYTHVCSIGHMFVFQVRTCLLSDERTRVCVPGAHKYLCVHVCTYVCPACTQTCVYMYTLLCSN